MPKNKIRFFDRAVAAVATIQYSEATVLGAAATITLMPTAALLCTSRVFQPVGRFIGALAFGTASATAESFSKVDHYFLLFKGEKHTDNSRQYAKDIFALSEASFPYSNDIDYKEKLGFFSRAGYLLSSVEYGATTLIGATTTASLGLMTGAFVLTGQIPFARFTTSVMEGSAAGTKHSAEKTYRKACQALGPRL